MYDKVKQWMYYFLIGVISFIALTFLPMLGTTVGLAWNIPNTVVGWIVWVVVKLIVSTLNVLIFHCFMLQAKVNVKEDPKYIEANNVLINAKLKDYIPRSPQQWNKEQYGKKAVSIFGITMLSTIALTQALLQYDWVSMLTYLFTIIMGLIFGILQMKNAEEYWTGEYWEYAQVVLKNQLEQEKLNDNSEQHDTQELVGTSTGEQTENSTALQC